MRKQFFVLLLGVVGFIPLAFADSQMVMISVNKTVPFAAAELTASKLEATDSNDSACFVQSHVSQYIPYPSCYLDTTCPYWGVALVKVDWSCEAPLKIWIQKIQANRAYTFYGNGQIGPFPVVSGGN
jgi:hypothetical protein